MMIDPKQIGPNPYLAEPNWFISWLTGNDQNTGVTIDAPLKTFAELVRRWGRDPVAPNFTTPSVTITVIDHNAADHIGVQFYNRIFTMNASVTIIAAASAVLQTGTFTAVRPKNVATNTPFGVTDSAITGGTWPVGRRIKILTGAAAGAWTWIVKNEGAQVARITSPSINGSTPVTPGVGDTYQIETLTDLFLANISSKGLGLVTTTVNVTDFNLRSTVSANIIAVQDSLRTLNFNRCSIASNMNVQSSANTRFFNSLIASTATFNATFMSSINLFLGGGIGNTITVSQNSMVASEGWLGQDRPIVLNSGAQGSGSEYGCMDCTAKVANPNGDGLLIGIKINVVPAIPAAWEINLGGRIWGAGHVGFGIALGINSLLTYESAADRPTITGASGDWRSAAPGSLQRSVGRNAVTQEKEGPFNNTWVNMTLPSPAGFGDCATDTRTGARIALTSRIFT